MMPLFILYFVISIFVIYISWRATCVAFCRKKKRLKAFEARMIADNCDNKIKRIEQGIYDDIKSSAFCGNKYVKVFIDKDDTVSNETISADLKRDGYKVSWNFSEKDNAIVYDIWW